MPAAQPTSSPSSTLPPLHEETVASHTAATKVGPIPSLTPAPSINELEDLLYDMLAAGGDANMNSAKLELIQAFLHEHARQRKTEAQFFSFFEQHSLSMRPERPNLFALPLVDSASRNAARTPPLLPAEPSPVEHAEPMIVETRSRFGWVWAALGFAAITGALALGASAVVVMRTELDRMNASIAHNAIELEQLRAETERLRTLLNANSAALQNTERDTRLLLQTFAPPIAQNSR
ncbi:MAG TPA: hypothetical protein VFN67_24035 [Polyangiales bacterium]|nr:hypothetical protein [Polyangiales bacterium]